MVVHAGGFKRTEDTHDAHGTFTTKQKWALASLTIPRVTEADDRRVLDQFPFGNPTSDLP